MAVRSEQKKGLILLRVILKEKLSLVQFEDAAGLVTVVHALWCKLGAHFLFSKWQTRKV